MYTSNTDSSLASTTVIIQPQASEIDSKPKKLIFRLGWISFILGVCAFLIHYVSIDYLANFSPMNAGIISGFFLIIAGLASVAAGYQETSYRYFVHAQVWSFIVNIIVAPGLIAVSIAAMITDSQDTQPLCQPTVSSSRAILFGDSLEIYPSDVPCVEIKKLFNLTQMLNGTQLIIGVVCFSVHMILLSMQRKVFKRIKKNDNEAKKNTIVYIQPNIHNTNYPATYTDAPPRYEDLPPIQIVSE